LCGIHLHQAQIIRQLGDQFDILAPQTAARDLISSENTNQTQAALPGYLLISMWMSWRVVKKDGKKER
jgi:hypothetical protein